MNNIRNVISQLAKSGSDTVAMVCTVDAVDKKARTIDCTPIDEGAPLLGVNIQANQGSDFGVCVFPEIGSYVVVGFMSDGAAAMVMLTDRIESAEIVIGTVSAVMNADGVTVSSGESTIKVTAGDIILTVANWVAWSILRNLPGGLTQSSGKSTLSKPPLKTGNLCHRTEARH